MEETKNEKKKYRNSVNISNAALGLPRVIKSSFTKSMRKQFIKAIKKTGKKKILQKLDPNSFLELILQHLLQL